MRRPYNSKRFMGLRGGYSYGRLGGSKFGPFRRKKKFNFRKAATSAAAGFATSYFAKKFANNLGGFSPAQANNIRNQQSPYSALPMTVPGMGVFPARRTLYGAITNPGGGITQSSYSSIAGSPIDSWIKEGQKYTYRVMDADSCIKLASTPPNNAVDSYVVSPVKLFRDIVNGAYYVGTGGGDNQQSGWLSQNTVLLDHYVHSIKSSVRVTSSTNMNTILRIYDLTAKLDTAASRVATPNQAWSQGVDETFGNSAGTTYRNEGIYPSHSKYFRDAWNVDKITEITLAAGASHEHTSTHPVHAKMPLWKLQDYTDAHTLAGFTHAYLFVLVATPVHDATTEANVGIGTASADVVIATTLETYVKTGKMPVIRVTNVTDTITTQEFIGDSSETETGNIS